MIREYGSGWRGIPSVRTGADQHGKCGNQRAQVGWRKAVGVGWSIHRRMLKSREKKNTGGIFFLGNEREGDKKDFFGVT